jgi:hypothetical protein
MRPLLVFVLTCACFLSLHAQEAIPDFGQFTAEEMQMKECSFDPTADAVVIFDHAKAGYDDRYSLITDRRVRIKVLKTSGVGYADIQIPFYSKDNFELITNIEAVSYNNETGNEVVTSLRSKDIYTRKVNNYYSIVSFAVPNVKAGTIFEYRYQSTMQNYGGLSDWIFQKDIPVMLSAYKLVILPNTEFNYSVYKSSFLSIKAVPDRENGAMYYEMKNIPGLRNEAFMTAKKDYMQRVTFQLSKISYRGGGSSSYTNTWKALAQELMSDKDFGQQTEKNVSIVLPANNTDALESEKITAVLNVIRSGFSWDGINSRFSVDGVKRTVEKKSGNSGDLNLLLINLLKKQGFEAYPFLVSERSHGRIDTSYPYIDQFNKVTALVKLSGGWQILDVSDPNCTVGLVPEQLLNTIGFRVDKKNYGLMPISDEQLASKREVTAEMELISTGSLTGKAVITHSNYGALSLRKECERNPSSITGRLIKHQILSGVDSLKNEEKADPLKFSQTFSFVAAPQNIGGYYALKYNLMDELAENPFTTNVRFTDIDFANRREFVQNLLITLPKGFTVDELPKDTQIGLPGNAIVGTRRIKKTDDNHLQVSLTMKVNQTSYDSNDYGALKQVFSKLVDAFNEPILIKESK